MMDIQSVAQGIAERLAGAWKRLSGTQQLTLRGLGIVAAVVAAGALVGARAPHAATADGGPSYTGTAVRSEFRLLGERLDTPGELELARLELERLEAILRYSTRYQIPADLSELIFDIALREGIDPELAFRLVDLESEFHVRARSGAAAVGLAQVQLATARFYEPEATFEDLYDPATNLRIGLRFLRDLIDAYGDVELALLAYNWGPSRLRELLAEGRDPRNGYASSIMEGYRGTW
jgi:soluble lytic murein transglycosylase-like protein